LSSSAPGNDEIPFHFLKALGVLVQQALAHLTNCSLQLKYLPLFLKKACTIVIKKSGKALYKIANSWHLIALLKIIEKVVKKVIIR